MSEDLNFESLCREIVKAVSSEIPPFGKVFLVMPHGDSNIGDSAIAFCTLQLFKGIGVEVDLLFPNGKPSRMIARNILNAIDTYQSVVFLPGGGNFGGLYPWNDELRLFVLNYFKRGKVVQLPQSIYFTDKNLESELREAFQSHRNCVLMVRDKESLAKVANWNMRIRLVPDLVSCLPPKQNLGKFEKGYLLRNDTEKVETSSSIESGLSFDWPTIPPLTRARRRISRELARSLPSFFTQVYPSNAIRHFRIEKFHFGRVVMGLDLLAKFKEIHSDRLHGAILASKAGANAIHLPSLTGKTDSYYKTWVRFI